MPRKRNPVVTRHESSTNFVDYVQRGGDVGLWLAKRRAQMARDGDTKAAYEILKDFVGAINQHNERTWYGLRSAPIHWEHARYIADAFEKIVRAAMRAGNWDGAKWKDVESGEAQPDAGLALGIKSSKPGRRAGKKTHNEEALAAAYNLLLLHGFTPKQAKLHLKEGTGASVRTIEKANGAHVTYRLHSSTALNRAAAKDVRKYAAKTIKRGSEPYAAKISAILAARKTKFCTELS